MIAVLTVTLTTVVAGTGPAGAAPSPSAAPVPCPVVPVTPQPPAVPSPLPTHDPGWPAIGGEQLATTGLAVPAGSPPLPTVLSASSWVVADLDSGAIVGACAPHAYAAPASLQKLLLALAVLPKLNPTDVVTVTAEDLNYEPGSSSVGLLLGGQYTVETLWLGLLLNSGNDAANVLARLGGGEAGQPGGMRLMNDKAEEIGALDTHAETPSGLDGPGQVTSAYDLALITRALFERDDFRRYVATRKADIPAQPQLVALPEKKRLGYQIQNDNRLLLNYPGALGGKTGFTDIARHTFVGAAERDGRRLVVTLLGAEHQPVRTWQQAAALLDWGFATAPASSVGQLVAPGEAQTLVKAAYASPEPTPVPAAAAAGGANSSRPALIGGVVLAGVFVVVWLGVLLFASRRRPAAAPAALPPTTAVPAASVPTTSVPTTAIPSDPYLTAPPPAPRPPTIG
jgi:D-alanyl-D-alanine carboxypeptidase (penicillin-binding protein 5/6)